MKRTWYSAPLLLAISVQLLAQNAPGRLPGFGDYLAGHAYGGVPATLKLNKPWAAMYAAEIRDGVEQAYGDNLHKGPNFAGHLIVVTWGCWAPCLRMAIVDAQTGEIYYPPLTFEGDGPQNFDLPLLTPPNAVSRNPEIQFRPNSDLMIIEATPSQSGNQPSYTFYFLWRQGRWTLLRKVPLATQ